jgi:PAS domain-containing protein
VRVAERTLAAIRGASVALVAVSLALLVTRTTWPLFAQTPYALLFVAILIAAQWADDMPGLLSIPLAAVGHFVIFRTLSPVTFGDWSLVVFVVLAFAMNRVIVSRRRTEAALRASEAELRSGWEHAAMGAAILNLDGHVIRINPAMARMFGCHEQGRSGVHYREMMQPADGQDEQAPSRGSCRASGTSTGVNRHIAPKTAQ